MKKALERFFKRQEDLSVAVAFAEAGEFDTAIEIVKGTERPACKDAKAEKVITGSTIASGSAKA